jgi:hypothetical protein
MLVYELFSGCMIFSYGFSEFLMKRIQNKVHLYIFFERSNGFLPCINLRLQFVKLSIPSKKF